MVENSAIAGRGRGDSALQGAHTALAGGGVQGAASHSPAKHPLAPNVSHAMFEKPLFECQ